MISSSLCYVLILESGQVAAATAWFVLTMLATALRTYGLSRLVRWNQEDPTAKLFVTSLLSLFTGVACGSILFFFPLVGAFERAMLTAMLISFCTGAVLINAGYRPIFLSFVLPIFGTMTLLWMINPGAPIEDRLALYIGVTLVFMLITLAVIAQETFNAFAQSVEISDRQTQLTDELTEALAAMKAARADAETSSRSKTRFISAASHDLRQPVHVLSMYGAILSSASVDSKTKNIVSNMNVAVESLSSQLSTLLDLSRLDSGEMKPEFAAINLCEVLNLLVRDIGQIAERQGITIRNEVEHPVHVWSDRDMLMRILQNLCGNALKYTQKGSIALRVRKQGETVCLQVMDTGIGIDEAEQIHIFDEFYQVANANRDTRMGLGLGLSIVERLVHSLNHQIEVQSKVGEGTCISLSMATCASAQGAEVLHSPGRPAMERVEAVSGLWVHVVDDDQAIRDSMGALLRERGCHVTETRSVADTCEFLEVESPSVILVDLRLAGENTGLDIIEWLNEHRPDLPAALITGEAVQPLKVFERFPNLRVLQKPVSESVLAHEINLLVRHSLASA